MPYQLTMSIYPKFEPVEIIQNLSKEIFTAAEAECIITTDDTLAYIQAYIFQHATRDGATGKLGRAIEKYEEGFGEAQYFCGIGKISDLDKNAPYWYLVNYGGFTVAAAQGWTIGGAFGGDNAPDASLAGTGKGGERFYSDGRFYMSPKNEMAAKNYIQAASIFLERNLNKRIKAILSQVKG